MDADAFSCIAKGEYDQYVGRFGMFPDLSSGTGNYPDGDPLL